MQAKPSTKTTTGGAAGAAVTVLTFIARTLGYEIPADVAAAAVLLVMLTVAYFMPATSGTYVDAEAARTRTPKH